MSALKPSTSPLSDEEGSARARGGILSFGAGGRAESKWRNFRRRRRQSSFHHPLSFSLHFVKAVRPRCTAEMFASKEGFTSQNYKEFRIF